MYKDLQQSLLLSYISENMLLLISYVKRLINVRLSVVFVQRK